MNELLSLNEMSIITWDVSSVQGTVEKALRRGIDQGHLTSKSRPVNQVKKKNRVLLVEK